MPKRGTKSARKVSRAMHEVFGSKKHKGQSRKKKVAIGLSKARAWGARIPKNKRGSK
jgi:hypothetical protein